MKKLIVILTVLMVMIFLPAVAGAATSPGSMKVTMIPADANWVLHFDISKFISTKLCNLLMEKTGGELQEANKKFSEQLHIDMLKDIYGITIFGVGKDKEKAVVCCTGNFDQKHILSLLDKAKDHKKIAYLGNEIHAWDNDQYGVFTGQNMLLIAKGEETIKNALDTIAGKKKDAGKSKLMEYLKDIPDEAFFRVAVDNVASLVGEHRPALLKQAGMAMFIALEKDNILGLKLKLTTETPAMAQNIEQMVKGFIALAALQKDSQDEDVKPFWKLADSLKISVKDNVVAMEFSHPTDELIKLFEKKVH